MPLIDEAELMDRMMTLLGAASSVDSCPKAEGMIEAPMEALNAPPRSFAQVFGTDGRLLAQLSVDAAGQGTPELSALAATLDRNLRDGTLDLPAASAPAPRIGRYVYPVV